MKESDKLGISGIVAEFNPFHNGHKYIVDCAKNDGHIVCAVISGNFVQRGDVSVISKFDRAKQALLCGVDIVCELPCPWSMSTAENFALGAVSQLNSLGVEIIYFGSESGDTDKLIRTAGLLLSDKFRALLKENLNSGKTFASIRQETLNKLNPELSDLLSNPNDTLAIEYIIAAKKINPKITFKAIKRVGAMHNDANSQGKFSTATLIRNKIKTNDYAYLERFMPQEAFNIIESSEISDISNIETAILSVLRRMTTNDFKKLPDISEGIENALYEAVKHSKTIEELYANIKSKRYTLARVRRLVLSAFVGIDNSFFKKEPPYTRILGFNDNGLKVFSNTPTKPIITKISQLNLNDSFTKNAFETECRATDLYALSLNDRKESGADFTTPIIKI